MINTITFSQNDFPPIITTEENCFKTQTSVRIIAQLTVNNHLYIIGNSW